MKKIYLVDVSSMFFRAFYAIRSLTNQSGMPTNAVYGLLSMTVKLLREKKPDYMAFCYDLPTPSFRKEIDPRYKANRSEMPEELVPQIPYIKELAIALGIPCFEKFGYEADDLIGTITKWARRENIEVEIVSGDKDFCQLVEPHVSIYDTMKEFHFDEAAVIEKWGIPPRKFVDYLSLVGDSSDNIKGVTGIGPKGAEKLLTQFDSLEDIYEHLEDVANKNIREKLANSKDDAFLSRRLVQIVLDIPLDLTPELVTIKPIDRENLKRILLELDFKSYVKTLLGDSLVAHSDANEVAEKKVTVADVVPVSEIKNWANTIESSVKLVDSFSHLQFKSGRLELSQLAKVLKPNFETWGFKNDRGIYLVQEQNIFELAGEPKQLGERLSTLNLHWKGADLKNFFKELFVLDPQVIWDQLLAAYVVRAGPVADVKELFKLYNAPIPELPSPEQYFKAHLLLEQELKRKLAEQNGEKVLTEMELPLIPILLKMEAVGIKLDIDLLKVESTHLAREIKELEKKIQELAETEFNVASPKQMGQVLFEKLKLPAGKKTKTGFSTDNAVLEKLALDHPIATYILDYRELSKLKSTYVDALPAIADKATHRVHTTFNQSLTTTGRLSSTNPNLQNIPIRSERGQLIRKAFISEEGERLVSADYSQIELRVLAHISGDEGLIAAFEKDLDIHTATASEIFAVPLESVSSDMRRKAKAVNFGLAYGQSAHGLAESLKIPRKEAAEIVTRYFQRFPKVKSYMHEIVETAKSQGYVESIFGRRRYLDELKSSHGMIRKFGERAAINAPMQGSVSDLVKKAMIEVHNSPLINELDARMLLQVHDELIFEVSKDNASRLEIECKQKMESAVQLRVPLRVDVAQGTNWDELH
jgi:DNA polymerase-1